MLSKVVIAKDACKGCELCVSICPKHVLALSGRLNAYGYHPAELTDEENCISCMMCSRMCPEAAIEVYKAIASVADTEKE